MKKKNLILNFDILSKNNITIEEFLFLYKIYFNKKYNDENINKQKLEKKLLLKSTEQYNILLRRGKELIESQLIEDTNLPEVPIYDEVDNFVEEFRKKWKGIAPGLMGSAKACRQNLTTWMNENPEYTKDEILKAADMYLRQQNNPKYIQRADYFIRKVEKGVITSRLSAYIDEIDSYTEENWTNNLN
jgi:hypothetical protein